MMQSDDQLKPHTKHVSVLCFPRDMLSFFFSLFNAGLMNSLTRDLQRSDEELRNVLQGARRTLSSRLLKEMTRKKSHNAGP